MAKQKELSDRTLSEVQAGAQRTRRNMAEGLAKSLLLELDRKQEFVAELSVVNTDERDLEVIVSDKQGIEIHRESFWVFPTDEFKTKLMLLNG